MKKVLFLSTCNTCQRILSEVKTDGFKLQDTKVEPASQEDIELLRGHVDSYEDLINKRAQLWQQRGLKNQDLSEDHYKNLFLEHYTLIKRPVFSDVDKVFIGNSKKVIQALKSHLSD
jgi:arsenate reductase